MPNIESYLNELTAVSEHLSHAIRHIRCAQEHEPISNECDSLDLNLAIRNIRSLASWIKIGIHDAEESILISKRMLR